MLNVVAVSYCFSIITPSWDRGLIVPGLRVICSIGSNSSNKLYGIDYVQLLLLHTCPDYAY